MRVLIPLFRYKKTDLNLVTCNATFESVKTLFINQNNAAYNIVYHCAVAGNHLTLSRHLSNPVSGSLRFPVSCGPRTLRAGTYPPSRRRGLTSPPRRREGRDRLPGRPSALCMRYVNDIHTQHIHTEDPPEYRGHRPQTIILRVRTNAVI